MGKGSKVKRYPRKKINLNTLVNIRVHLYTEDYQNYRPRIHTHVTKMSIPFFLLKKHGGINGFLDEHYREKWQCAVPCSVEDRKLSLKAKKYETVQN